MDCLEFYRKCLALKNTAYKRETIVIKNNLSDSELYQLSMELAEKISHTGEERNFARHVDRIAKDYGYKKSKLRVQSMLGLASWPLGEEENYRELTSEYLEARGIDLGDLNTAIHGLYQRMDNPDSDFQKISNRIYKGPNDNLLDFYKKFAKYSKRRRRKEILLKGPDYRRKDQDYDGLKLWRVPLTGSEDFMKIKSGIGKKAAVQAYSMCGMGFYPHSPGQVLDAGLKYGYLNVDAMKHYEGLVKKDEAEN